MHDLTGQGVHINASATEYPDAMMSVQNCTIRARPERLGLSWAQGIDQLLGTPFVKGSQRRLTQGTIRVQRPKGRQSH